MTELEVIHQTRYRYPAPVSLAHHLAHLQPLQDADQRLAEFTLRIDPPPSALVESLDRRGNVCRTFSVLGAHDSLSVKAHSRVQLRPRFAALAPAASPPWETVAERLRYVARADFEPAVEFTMPSPYVARLQALRSVAVPSFPAGRPLALAALDLMQRIHRDFAYVGQSTTVDTPLAQVLAQRSGVCQDFAHLMSGALRMLGLPARYVSGYLLTRPPGGQTDLIGADASHAWVQVWCPDTPGMPADGWLDLDPTNDMVPDTGHVRLAVGRDYGDVTPLRGVIRGGGRHTLAVEVHTRMLS